MSRSLDRVLRALEAGGFDPRPTGTGYRFRCPAHDDGTPSGSLTVGEDGRVLVHCHAGCPVESVVAALGLTLSDLFEDPTRDERRIAATYDYHDEQGALLYQVVRYDPKAFRLRRPDGRGGWEWKLGETRRVLYRLPLVVDLVQNGGTIYITEGEKDADAVNASDPDRAEAFCATCNPMGAGKWDDAYADSLVGARRVVIWADKDQPGRQHAQVIAASLRGRAGRVEIVESKEGKDAADHLASGCSLDEALVVESAPEPTTLDDVVGTFRKWQHLPDERVLLTPLAVYAANLMPGDPVWLLMVAPGGWGKTETIQPLAGLPNVRSVSTLTEASLLSGTAKRDKAKEAKGGLLREIGEFGIILCKDFGSVLSLHRDARAAVLAALREVYDGSYTRCVGTDGGRSLSWQGKVGLIAACTPTIDPHQAVMAAMGERFILFRLPEVSASELAQRALAHSGREGEMRRELHAVVRGLLEDLALPTEPKALDSAQQHRLIAMAMFVARARAPVERDGYQREIELVPGAEAPTRIVITLARLLGGLQAIGASERTSWSVLEKVALDCLPMLRKRILDLLATVGGKEPSTADVAEALGYPSQTARRALEDLAVYGLVERESLGRGKPDCWRESEWTRTVRVDAFGTVPEESGDMSGGTVPEKSDDIRSIPPSSSLMNPEHTFDDFSGKVSKIHVTDCNKTPYSAAGGVIGEPR